jgi:hypothetical protein
MVRTDQKTGTVATVAIIAAVLSFVMTFAGHALLGFFSGVISIPLGIMGLFMAASPRVGGGMLSIAAIVLGLFAVGVAVVGGVGAMIF